MEKSAINLVGIERRETRRSRASSDRRPLDERTHTLHGTRFSQKSTTARRCLPSATSYHDHTWLVAHTVGPHGTSPCSYHPPDSSRSHHRFLRKFRIRIRQLLSVRAAPRAGCHMGSTPERASCFCGTRCTIMREKVSPCILAFQIRAEKNHVTYKYSASSSAENTTKITRSNCTMRGTRNPINR
jgi:hypothetical protein